MAVSLWVRDYNKWRMAGLRAPLKLEMVQQLKIRPSVYTQNAHFMCIARRASHQYKHVQWISCQSHSTNARLVNSAADRNRASGPCCAHTVYSCAHAHTHTHSHSLTVAVTNHPCDAKRTTMVAGPVVAYHPALRTTEPQGNKQHSPWDQSYATVSDNPHRYSTQQVDKKGRTHSPPSLRDAQLVAMRIAHLLKAVKWH